MVHYVICLFFTLLYITGINCQQLQDSLDQMDQALLQLTASLQQLADRLDEGINAGNQADFDAKRLMVTLADVEVPQCSRGRFVCGDSLQCVSKLFVCDGSPDCVNGADEEEELCRYPFKFGGKYVGTVTYGTCNMAVTDGRFSPNEEIRLDWFLPVSDMVYKSVGIIDNSIMNYEFDVRGVAQYNYAERAFTTTFRDALNLLYSKNVVDPVDSKMVTTYIYRLNDVDANKYCFKVSSTLVD